MPKTAGKNSRTIARKLPETKQGYFIYSDGSSTWGIGVYRGETPLRTTEEIHQNKNIAEKIDWHKKETERIAETKTEANK